MEFQNMTPEQLAGLAPQHVFQLLGNSTVIKTVGEKHTEATKKFEKEQDAAVRGRKIADYTIYESMAAFNSAIEAKRNHLTSLKNWTWYATEVASATVHFATYLGLGALTLKIANMRSSSKQSKDGKPAEVADAMANPFQTQATDRPIRPSRELKTA